MPESETTSESETAEARSARKVREGIVTSDAMDKTVVVKVERRFMHTLYKKFMGYGYRSP
jgi:small subunit ribosomal protein S17